jgi:hypothetical protein
MHDYIRVLRTMQAKALPQPKSGQGNNIPTTYKVQVEDGTKHWHRVYRIVYPGVDAWFIKKAGARVFISEKDMCNGFSENEPINMEDNYYGL